MPSVRRFFRAARVCQWLVLDGLVLRPDGCGVKLGEVFVPDIQEVLINLGEEFP